jgi:predicted permease
VPGRRRAFGPAPPNRGETGISGEIEEEIAFHIEEKVRSLIAQGMDEEGARREACRSFGDVDRVTTELERRQRAGRVAEWGIELRHSAACAMRSLGGGLGFTAVSAVTLALGIGATTAVFTVVHSVLLSPLPFEDSDELVAVWHRAPGLGLGEANLSPAMALSYRDENRVFEDMGFWNTGLVSLSGITEPEQVSATYVSAGLFPVLRVVPLLGRGFTEEEDAADATPTVLLGESYWRRRFGSDQGVVGETLRVDGMSREIVGVAPEIPPLEADLYLPMQWDPDALPVDWSYQAVGRLLPGAPIEQAEADVSRMIPMLPELSSGGVSERVVALAQLAPYLRSMKQDFVGNVGEVLWVLLGSVGIVLLIACANVANLFMVRAESRRQELAIRTALGAARSDLRCNGLGTVLHAGARLGASPPALGHAGAAQRGRVPGHAPPARPDRVSAGSTGTVPRADTAAPGHG